MEDKLKANVRERVKFLSTLPDCQVGTVNNLEPINRLPILYVQSRTEIDTYDNLKELEEIIEESNENNDLFGRD